MKHSPKVGLPVKPHAVGHTQLIAGLYSGKGRGTSGSYLFNQQAIVTIKEDADVLRQRPLTSKLLEGEGSGVKSFHVQHVTHFMAMDASSVGLEGSTQFGPNLVE